VTSVPGVRIPPSPHMIKLEHFKKGNYYYINAYSGDTRVGKLGIEYRGSQNIHINYVITSVSYTGKGIATMMINKAIELFKGYDISLYVVPMPRSEEKIKYKTIKGLSEFYNKFGFVRTDDPCLVEMILKR